MQDDFWHLLAIQALGPMWGEDKTQDASSRAPGKQEPAHG
jgi:hypothetical protein